MRHPTEARAHTARESKPRMIATYEQKVLRKNDKAFGPLSSPFRALSHHASIQLLFNNNSIEAWNRRGTEGADKAPNFNAIVDGSFVTRAARDSMHAYVRVNAFLHVRAYSDMRTYVYILIALSYF